MSLISVIIPVYNVAEYLEACLDSIIGQTYEHLEILVVDDGSTDGSATVCDGYGAKDARVKVIHQENRGLSGARNTGLDHAQGEYVSFVDADDHLELKAYEKLIQVLEEKTCDICFFGHYRVTNEKAMSYDKPPKKQVYRGAEEIVGTLFTNALKGKPGNGGCFTGLSVWSGIYRRTVIEENGLRFESEKEVLSEDILFNLQACMCADFVMVYPEYLYYYVLRQQSLTQSYREDRFDAALNLDAKLKGWQTEHQMPESFEQGIQKVYAMNLIVCLKQEVEFQKQNGIRTVLDNIKKITNHAQTKHFLQDKKNAEGILQKTLFGGLRLSLWHFVYLIIALKCTGEKVSRERSEIGKKLILFQMLLILVAFFGETVIGIPHSVIYAADLVNVMLFGLSLGNIKNSKEKTCHRAVVFIAIFLFYTLSVFVINGQSVFYYLWGLRNVFRFYLFFISCMYMLDYSLLARLKKILEVFLYLNVLVCSWQFFVEKLPFDNICGLFGNTTLGSGYMNVLLILITVMAAVNDLNQKNRMKFLVIQTGCCAYISVISELKAYYIELALIVFLALLVDLVRKRKIHRKIITVGTICICGMFIIAFLTVKLNPEYWEGFFTPLGIWQEATRTSGYSASGDINRLNGISTLYETIFKGSGKAFWGYGLGNCDYSSGHAFLTSPFYLQYEHLHYVWIMSAFLFLELGFAGMLFYTGFFGLVVAVAHQNSKRYRLSTVEKYWNEVSAIVAVCCLFLFLYNSSLRTEAGYFIFLFLAIPFLIARKKWEEQGI